MKNLKKVLALALAFACTVTSFASAKVFPDVPAGSEHSEAISFLSDLGIIAGDTDGNYHPERTITRAEACALMARMMTGSTTVSQWAGASNFTDVAASHWAESAVGYAVANGIAYGYGDGTFRPDQAISDQEFVAMLTRAMGYDTAANRLSYPYGNLTVAQQKGLLEGVNIVPTSDALRGEDAQMIYNALFADYARSTSQSNTIHGSTDANYVTIAEEVFGLGRYCDDADDCSAHYWVITGTSITDENTIVAYNVTDNGDKLVDAKNAVEFIYEGDAEALIGYKVELWGEIAHKGDLEVKAVKVLAGQTANAYNASMRDGNNNNEIEGVFAKDLDFNDLKFTSKTDIEQTLNTKNAAQYTLFDWNDDGEVDYIKTTRTAYFTVDSLTSKTIKLTSTAGKTLSLDLDGQTEMTFSAYDQSTELASGKYKINAEIPADVEEGDIVSFSYTLAYKNTVNATMAIVSPEAMEVTDISSKKEDGMKIVSFDDEQMFVAAKNYAFDTDLYAGLVEDSETLYDVWTNANGFIIKLAESETAFTGYVYVTGYAAGANSTGNRKLVEISGVTGTNEAWEDVELASDAKVYIGGTATNAYNKSSRVVDLTDGFVGYAYKYTMNEDKQITKLEQVALTKEDNYNYNAKTEVIDINNNDGKLKEDYYMTDAKIVFVVKGDPTIVNTASTVELDTDDVMAVEAEDLPTIDGGNIKASGVAFDASNDGKDNIKAAVLGVDSFKYFTGTDVYVALISEVGYKSSTDTYRIEAYIPQLDGESATYVTIDADDVEMGKYTDGKFVEYNTTSKVTTASQVLGDLNAVYAEVEVQDGKIVSLAVMEDKKKDGNPYGDLYGADYVVARMIAQRVSAKDVIVHSWPVGVKDQLTGKINLEAVDAANSDPSFQLTDKTVYAMFSDDYDFIITEGKQSAATFEKDFSVDSIETGKVEDLASYVRNNDDDEYVVVDVIVEIDSKGEWDDEVIAAIYFEDVVTATAPVEALAINVEGALAYGSTDKMVEVTVFYKAEGESSFEENDTEIEPSMVKIFDAKKVDVTDDFSVSVTNENDVIIGNDDNLPKFANVGTYTVEVSVGKKTTTATFAVEKGVKAFEYTLPSATIGNNIQVTVADADQADVKDLVAKFNSSIQMNSSLNNATGVPTVTEVRYDDNTNKLTLTLNGGYTLGAGEVLTAIFQLSNSNYNAGLKIMNAF